MSSKKRFDYPTVIILRHDKTKMNADSEEKSRLKGTEFDLPLTAEGKTKARQDAVKLKGYDIASITTSAMKRAQQSSEPLASIIGIPAIINKGYNPWDVGYLAGHTREDAHDRVVYYIEHCHQTVPEGASYEDFWDAFTVAISKDMKAAQKEEADGMFRPRVVFTHSCDLLALEAFIDGGKPKPHTGEMPSPGSMSLLQKRKGGWQLDFDFLGTEAQKVGVESAA